MRHVRQVESDAAPRMARQARFGVLDAHVVAPAQAASAAGLIFAMIPAESL
jgi:hypothetical protein